MIVVELAEDLGPCVNWKNVSDDGTGEFLEWGKLVCGRAKTIGTAEVCATSLSLFKRVLTSFSQEQMFLITT